MLAVVRVTLTFNSPTGWIELAASSQLQIDPLRPEDTKDWPNRIGCVAAFWLGKRRFIPAIDLAPLDESGGEVLAAAKRALEERLRRMS